MKNATYHAASGSTCNMQLFNTADQTRYYRWAICWRSRLHGFNPPDLRWLAVVVIAVASFAFSEIFL